MSYCYSTNEENFYGEFESIGDALVEAFDDPERKEAWVGESKQFMAGDFVTTHIAYTVMESMAETAGDECGEAAEGWLVDYSWPYKFKEGTPEREAEQRKKDIFKAEVEHLRQLLSVAVNTWADDHGYHPRFFGVENVQHWTREQFEGFGA